ncbi:MAG: hypothetical protein IK016_05590, partial [Lachnospiraceae bacterium]|nr:hypothetical protein [Lachnospiraceae bacterium]
TGGSAAVTATKEAELTGSLTSFTSTAAGTQKEEPDTAGASTARGSATGDEMARELPRRLTILMIALIIAYRNVQDSARPFRKKRRLNSP